MPIYEYTCKSCTHQFETLILKGAVPVCPVCKSQELERLFSLPAVSSETTRANALKAAKRRNASQGKEREAAQREYEASHDND